MVSAGVNTQLQPTEDLDCLVQLWEGGGWDGQKSSKGCKPHQRGDPQAFNISYKKKKKEKKTKP